MLVNNAGVVSRTPIADVTDREWARVLAINLTGPMIGTRAVLPLMRDSGGGSIVNIASTAALVGHPGSKSWGRVENRLAPALPHQTVHAVFPHTAFRCSSRRGMRLLPASHR